MSNEQFLKNNFNNNNNKYNGRVNLIYQPPNVLNLQDKVPINSNSFHNSLTNIQESSTLSKCFFSNENIKILQNAIRKGVYDKSQGKYIIDEQCQYTLNIIMRSIYLQHSCNLETNITKQIITLNNLVTNYAINQIYGEAGGYIKFKDDVSTLAMPISRPIYANKTKNTLELKPWF